MKKEEPFERAFIGTLGLQPQVITRSIDCLLDKGTSLKHAALIHTKTYHKHDMWETFADFTDYLEERYFPITWEFVPLQEEGKEPLKDIKTPEEAELSFRTIFQTMRQLKKQEYRLEGFIAGGRKSSIVYTMIAAQLLYEADDHLWHLFSTQEDRAPHVKTHESQLVEIPVFKLAPLIPVMHQFILDSDDPTKVMKLYQQQEKATRLLQMQIFFESRDEVEQQIIRYGTFNYTNKYIAAETGYSQAIIGRKIKKIANDFYRSPATPRKILSKNRPKQIGKLLFYHLKPLMSYLENKFDSKE